MWDKTKLSLIFLREKRNTISKILWIKHYFSIPTLKKNLIMTMKIVKRDRRQQKQQIINQIMKHVAAHVKQSRLKRLNSKNLKRINHHLNKPLILSINQLQAKVFCRWSLHSKIDLRPYMTKTTTNKICRGQTKKLIKSLNLFQKRMWQRA